MTHWQRPEEGVHERYACGAKWRSADVGEGRLATVTCPACLEVALSQYRLAATLIEARRLKIIKDLEKPE